VSADLHASVAVYLAGVDQRYTAGRRALVTALKAAGRPITLPDILAAVPGVPQSSAYRNLAVLEGAGVVHRVMGPGDFARYELAEDLTEHHHHLVCSECGSVVDVSMPARLERALEKTLEALATEAGFEVDAHRLDLLGRCAACVTSRASGRAQSRMRG
jgi:Fe2+ or Zn2+ uptake regulation protein